MSNLVGIDLGVDDLDHPLEFEISVPENNLSKLNLLGEGKTLQYSYFPSKRKSWVIGFRIHCFP